MISVTGIDIIHIILKLWIECQAEIVNPIPIDRNCGHIIQNSCESNRTFADWVFSMSLIHFRYKDHFGHNEFSPFEVIREQRFQSLKISFAPGFRLTCLNPVRYGLDIRKIKLSIPVLINSLRNILASFIDKIGDSFYYVVKHLPQINTHEITPSRRLYFGLLPSNT